MAFVDFNRKKACVVWPLNRPLTSYTKRGRKKKTQWAFDLRPEGVTCVASEVVKVNHEPPGSLPGFEDDLTQLPNCVITTSLDACWKTPFISFCYERSKDLFHYQNLIHSGR